MKVFVYSCRTFDEDPYFEQFSREFGIELGICREAPTLENAHLAKGYDAISVITTKVDGALVEKFHEMGVKMISTRTIGYDHIDLEKAKELGVKPMATFVAGALAGCRPEVMGIGPVPATKKVMAKTGMKIEDFDIIEANEAFAAQSVAVGKELGIDVDKQLNPNGGAIALGHPVGASGARILVTLLHEMEAKDAKKGLATLCIGGGMGCATIVERE